LPSRPLAAVVFAKHFCAQHLESTTCEISFHWFFGKRKDLVKSEFLIESIIQSSHLFSTSLRDHSLRNPLLNAQSETMNVKTYPGIWRFAFPRLLMGPLGPAMGAFFGGGSEIAMLI
jgi:hypothetical protein